MNQIKCQAKHNKVAGCSTCGGYGYVLEKNQCPSCGHEYWDRERAGTTVYDGKVITAFDGTEIYWHHSGSTCSYCEEEREG